MHRLIFRFIITTSLCCLAYHAHAQLVINEFMQSNIDCVMDDLNEFPDSWVELYNAGDSRVSLSDYSIGCVEDSKASWSLPQRIIGSHQYILIFCDKAANKLHTDFRIDSDKGASLFLFKQGTVVDCLRDIAKQPAPNISYGRKDDGGSEWGYQEYPTPNASNCGTICSEVLKEPVFSEKGRVILGNPSFTLNITVPEGSPNSTIVRYTLDGSEPTVKSQVFSNPINISSTRTIRAKLFCKGFLSPPSSTQSYIFFPRELTLPVISIVTNNAYFYDDKKGIYVKGSYKSGTNNYSYDWRRPINIEYFEKEDAESQINQLCETRIQGGASRDAQLKSLVVYAHKRFGKKRLKYEFFPDQKPGLKNFKSIILRNAGNDFDYLYMRDAVIQRTMAKYTDLDWQAWKPAIIYINGTYKGILNIRERSTADNIFSNYDGLEDIDMIENWKELKEGDFSSWEEFVRFYNEKGHTLEEFEERIDWKEFINLMIMNLYYCNLDFPGNNIVVWKPRTPDGKWRFVAKDTDFGLGLYGCSSSYNTIEWLYNPNYDYNRNWANQAEHTLLFRRMMEDSDFKREFIDRCAIYMGDFLNSATTREIWDEMYEIIRKEYPHHRKLINQWWPDYNSELNNARNWLKSRTNNFYRFLTNYYQLGTSVPIQINIECQEEDLSAVSVDFNGVTLSKSKFNGKFFVNRTMTLESHPVNGRKITGWRIVQITNKGATETQEISTPTLSMAIPSCSNLKINAIFADHDDISESVIASAKWWVDNNILHITDVAPGTPVSIYKTNGIILYNKVADGGQLSMSLPPHEIYILKIAEKSYKIIP